MEPLSQIARRTGLRPRPDIVLSPSITLRLPNGSLPPFNRLIKQASACLELAKRMLEPLDILDRKALGRGWNEGNGRPKELRSRRRLHYRWLRRGLCFDGLALDQLALKLGALLGHYVGSGRSANVRHWTFRLVFVFQILL